MTRATHDALALNEPMTEQDLAALRAAVHALERTSLAQKLSALAGRQLGFAGRVIPVKLQQAASAAARTGLESALRVALSSLAQAPRRDLSRFHRRLAAASGAFGGAIGIASLPLELPVSTVIMLRAIADVARNEGEDLSEPDAALACLQVFGLGGHAENGNVFEGGYFALRGLFAKSVSDAARYVAQRAAADEAAPVLVRLVGQIAARYGVAVSQKAVAQAIPVLGAMGGAAVNLAFVEHFQGVARGHFTVRRLERAYGPDTVRRAYERVAQEAGFARTG